MNRLVWFIPAAVVAIITAVVFCWQEKRRPKPQGSRKHLEHELSFYVGQRNACEVEISKIQQKLWQLKGKAERKLASGGAPTRRGS